MKLVIPVTVEWNIREVLTVLNIPFPPGNLIFAIAYAAKEEKNRLPVVPITDTNTVLKMYLEKGTQEVFIKTNKSVKLESVGFTT